MKVLLWHVHAAWATSFVSGGHDYLVPVLPDRGPDGRGRPRTYPWPDHAVEVSPRQLRDADVDVVVVQRPEEVARAEEWTGRTLGRRLPAVVVEHNAPRGRVPWTRHWAADRDDLTVVHVTHFNDLMWDCGTTRTRVIEHGVADTGARWAPEVRRAAVVVNEPVRRGRVVGADLVPRVAGAVPVDLFGIGVEHLAAGSERTNACGDLAHDALLTELSRRAVYVHPFRWTSLGLSLLEAMTLGMPVAGLATTEAARAVPPEAGVVTTDVDELVRGARDLVEEPERAALCGKAARDHALARYGLSRFLADWDELLTEVGGS